MIQTTFTSDNGIYGKTEYAAYQTQEGSAFAIFKGRKTWTLGHPHTGLSLESLIPNTMQRRTRKALMDHVKAIEAALPDECAVMATAGPANFTKAQKEAMQAVIDKAREVAA
jgi:hypothetical protein